MSYGKGQSRSYGSLGLIEAGKSSLGLVRVRGLLG